jgi:integrase
MQSNLDEREVVMDDALMDAAERVLFATVGKKQQEYPMLVPLREFLKAYLAAEPALAGRDVPSLEKATGLACPGAVEDAKRRSERIPPFLVHDAYRDAVMRAGGLPHARLRPEALYSIAPRGWVPIVAALIADGPELAGARAQAAIFDFSMGSVRANRRRPAGRRAASSVKHVLLEGQRLLRLAHGLQMLPACAHWTYIPQLEIPHMPMGGYEVVAPRVEVVRMALQKMNAEIHTRLGVSAIEEEIAGLDALTDEILLSRGLWRPMRDRLLLVLMVLTGGRRAAISRLRREDYIRDHIGPQPDCRRGTVLHLRPQKGKDRDEIRRKPIPQQAALVIESYLTLMDRILAAKGQPLAAASAPLLVAVASHHTQPPQPSWLHRRVAGKSDKEWPLLVRDPEHLPKHVTPEEAATCGYTPHEFRHFSNQLAEGAGYAYNGRHPTNGPMVNPPPAYYAAALLDNGGAEEKMRALYGGRTGAAMLEVVAGRAAELGWEILTGRLGERKRPNIDAYEQELVRLHRIEDEERRLERAAEQLQQRRTRSAGLALPRGEVPTSERLQVIMRRQEDLIASVDELKETLLESSAITHQMVQLSRQKADTIKKLDLYRLDRGTWLPVPDSEPPGAEKVDWNAIDEGKLGKPLMPGAAPSAVRDWVTFREFCAILDLQARSTLTRWVKGEHLPARRDRRPWEPGHVPVDDSLGVNYRRIWIPGVNEALWRPRLRREQLEQALSRWPSEQGWTTKDEQPTPRCLEPIRLSAPTLQLAA